jgi:hypothetical protein
MWRETRLWLRPELNMLGSGRSDGQYREPALVQEMEKLYVVGCRVARE